MQVYQQFDAGIVPPPSNLITKKSPKHVFSFELSFTLQLYQKYYSNVDVFIWIFQKIILQGIYKGFLLMIWSLLPSFARFIVA